ncbi:hypothetical protein MPH47_09750 [Psychrobacillus psychrodurans]|uniref:hypothetical protein n=1 Tax=Psychrobacillus psychrodurans TaxID=126157 RepID=UPI001F4DC246|nr:hypothetical protein [Psychrobacillus psychrodurans]MCK1997500.1 hypothetical protein [Psychrobacillus psychrodurans]
MEESFCKYVDELSCFFNDRGINFAKINSEYNFCFPDESYSELLIKELEKKIEELLIVPEGMKIYSFYRLANHLVLKHLVEGKEISDYLKIIQQIQYRFGNNGKIVPLTEEKQWKEIIKIIIYIEKLNKNQHTYAKAIESYTNEYQVGKSVQYLIGKGYEFSVKENQIEYLSNSYLRIANEIEKIIVELGGINIIEELLKKLYRTYSTEYKRFFLIRKTTGLMGINPVEPEIPWGYLIGLCAKKLTRRSIKKVKPEEIKKQKEYINKKYEELYSLSKAYISSLKIQDFNPYQHMFVDLEDLPLYIKNNVLFDNIVHMQQWNPTYIPNLLEGLLSPYFQEEVVKKQLPFTLDEFVSTAKVILDMGNPINIIEISRDDIIKNVNIKPESIERILQIISKDRKNINRKFLVPHNKNEVFNKPLIQVSEGKYVLINPSLCSFGFFESITQVLRTLIKDFDSSLGFYLEDYVKIKLQEKRISYQNGFYGTNEECDLLIENDKNLLYFEIKKKALTQDSISGNDVKIFDDLSKSLIATQKQLGKHEIHIKKEGEMELREKRSNKSGKKGNIHMIKLDNRQINKISISLNEFGFLNDTLIVSKLLSNIVQGEVRSENEEEDKQLEQLRVYILELREQVKELGQLNHNRDNLKPFFNCNFYSLQQLLTIIADSNSKEDFIKKIRSTHHITMGTCNFYYEYDQVNKKLPPTVGKP